MNFFSTKRKAIFILFLFLGLTLFQMLPSQSANKFNSNRATINNVLDSITYIEASDPYDYGLKVAKLHRPTYRLLNFITILLSKNNIDQKQAENQLISLKKSSPIFYEELRGLSDGLNIKINRFVNIAEFIPSVCSRGCTATISTGKATKNNDTFLTFNLDSSIDSIRNIIFTYFLHRVMSYKVWVVKINTMQYRYAFWGIPIIYELPFINEKGLGWGAPGTIFSKKREVDRGPGIPTMMLERLTMMTCKNVTEVAALWSNMERANQNKNSFSNIYDGSSEVFCDKEGGILVIEQTHNYIIKVFRNSTDITGSSEDILWHANHHIWLDPNLTGSVLPEEYMGSYYRNKRACELLEENYGNITLETCKEICRDHSGGTDKNGKDSSDICRHPDRNATKITANSWIIQPKEMIVYWTHGSPCKSRFVEKDFSKIFKER